MIKYLPYHSIHKQQWDTLVQESSNGLVYDYSFYLDAMADEWDALVLNDYEAVMPLPWRKKYGIKYVYQPPFLQQSGIISREELPQQVQQEFAEQLSRHFIFAETALNFGNKILSKKSLHIKYRNNYILSLQPSYESISANYHQSLQQKLRGAAKQNLHYKTAENINGAVDLYRYLYHKKMRSVNAKDYDNLKAVSSLMLEKGMVIMREVYKGKELVAALLMLKDHRRLYNLASCIMPAGRKVSANDFLYDQLIREFAGSDLLFDFEGSDVEGIRKFYEKFGGQNQPYPFLKFNNLPFWAKIFKR